jgi:hypothetical protein
MCEIQLSCCMEVLNACANLDAFENQAKYVWTTLQTIESGCDSYFFIGYSFFDLYVKCGSKEIWQIDYPLLLVHKNIFGWRNTTLLSLFSALIWSWNELFNSIMCTSWKRNCAWKKYEFNFCVWLKLFYNILGGVFLKAFFPFCFSSYCIFILYLFNAVIFFWILKTCCFKL